MAISKEEILVEIRKFVAANGGAIPGERTFVAATRIKQSAWKGKYWARWTDAVREAGHDPNAMTQKISDEDILEQLAGLITTLGYFPVRDEINMRAQTVPGFPVWQTIKKRYGGMPQTAAALLEFSRITANTKLAKLCEERIEREALKPKHDAHDQRQPMGKTGFVYLKYSPSLRLYKIGKANDADRRGAGISLLLPEDLIPKHEIKTDCPYILEKYWENRFRAKKKQDEWYDLTTADITTFKKRRAFIFSEFFSMSSRDPGWPYANLLKMRLRTTVRRRWLARTFLPWPTWGSKVSQRKSPASEKQPAFTRIPYREAHPIPFRRGGFPG